MATVAKVELARQEQNACLNKEAKMRDKTNPKNNRQREKKQTNKQTKFSVIISKFYSQDYNEVPTRRVAALLWGQIVFFLFCSNYASLFVGKTQFLSVARLYAVCSSIPCALATLDLRFSALPPVFMLEVIYVQL